MTKSKKEFKKEFTLVLTDFLRPLGSLYAAKVHPDLSPKGERWGGKGLPPLPSPFPSDTGTVGPFPEVPSRDGSGHGGVGPTTDDPHPVEEELNTTDGSLRSNLRVNSSTINTVKMY